MLLEMAPNGATATGGIELRIQQVRHSQLPNQIEEDFRLIQHQEGLVALQSQTDHSPHSAAMV